MRRSLFLHGWIESGGAGLTLSRHVRNPHSYPHSRFWRLSNPKDRYYPFDVHLGDSGSNRFTAGILGSMGGLGGNGRFSRIARLLGLAAGCLALANCASGNMSSRVDPNSIALTTSADAKHSHDRNVCNERGCSDRTKADGAASQHVTATNGDVAIVGGRPAGCPHNFCGCEASRYLFGEIRPELNLASNWIRKFPHTSPASGMAAARNHHVMVLISHVDGSDWLVHDGNSGAALTREHVRSISGYIVVDPRTRLTAVMAK